jgi:hypothetical protein
MDVLRQRLRQHSLINLNCFFRGIENHKTIRALSDVRLYPAAQLDVPGLIEIIVELLKELFTCKQKRRPLSA